MTKLQQVHQLLQQVQTLTQTGKAYYYGLGTVVPVAKLSLQQGHVGQFQTVCRQQATLARKYGCLQLATTLSKLVLLGYSL